MKAKNIDIFFKNIKVNKTTLVFIISFIIIATFLYRLFFRPFGILMFFLVTNLLIGMFWSQRNSWMFRYLSRKINYFPYWSTFFALTLFCLIFLPLELYFTEIAFKIVKVPSLVGVLVLLLFCFLSSVADWQHFLARLDFKLQTILKVIAFAFIIFGANVFLVYHQEKLSREYLPKIYSISPEWGLQAQIVTIKGVNFGPIWKSGRVVLGNEEWTIKSWTDTEILAEQPVSIQYGVKNFIVVRRDNIFSNDSLPYVEKDPSTVK